MKFFWLLLPFTLLADDACVACHAAPAAAYANDVHQRAGFACAGCHTGDHPAKVSRTAAPKLCARCHSDSSVMRKYKPQQRVDQYAQYLTSKHGKALAAGDTSAANCVDCHGVHNIRAVRDAQSPVHPLQLPATCARCHADAALMDRHKLPATPFAEYRSSVHWEALAKRRDLSAPACASCHGNHGATPPQVASVAAVCGTCHALFEELYRKSPHQPVFTAMGVGGCVACHGNHAVAKPSDTMLAGEGAVCANCHDGASAGGKTAAAMHTMLRRSEDALNRSEEILGRARRAGMEVSESVLRLQEGREALVKARVAVHGFRVEEVAKPAQEGLAIASETLSAGEAALRERDARRRGLGVSLAAILAALAGLALAIRSIEGR